MSPTWASAACTGTCPGCSSFRRLHRNVPWLQLVVPGESEPDPDAIGVVYVTGETFRPVPPERANEGQALGLVVRGSNVDEAVPFALDSGFDLLVVDSTIGIETAWPELEGAPDLSAARDTVRKLRALKREGDIEIAYFGGIRSGTDLAKLLGLGSHAGIVGVSMGLALGGEIVPSGNRQAIVFPPDLNGNPEETRHPMLSPYLFDAGGLADPHLTVHEESAPINGMEKLIIGSKPIDGGHYIFDAEDRCALLEEEPDAAPFLRPFVGAREYLQGGKRWILALHNAAPDVLARLPRVRERIAAVRAYRQASKSRPTQELAKTPTLYHVNVVPTAPFLVVPEVSSERREYVPMGWLEPPAIPSNKLRLLFNATLAEFALLTSAMHMAWMRTVTGRMKSDYMYSVGVVYNTFPMPPQDADLSKLEPLAQAVLDARAVHPGATLAELYDPDLMPPNLRRAHQALDRAVDRLYRPRGFASERNRVEYLFMLYEKMRAPLSAARKAKPRRKRRNAQGIAS